MTPLKAYFRNCAGLTTVDFGLLALGLAGFAISILVMLDPELDVFFGLR